MVRAVASTPRPLAIDWEKLLSWVGTRGPEQGVLNLANGQVVFRLLSDNYWEDDEVAAEVAANPAQFVDLPHAGERERGAWRVEFAAQHTVLRPASAKREVSFERAVRLAGLDDRWRAFRRASMVGMLVDWFKRQGVRPEPSRPRRKSGASRRARAG